MVSATLPIRPTWSPAIRTEKSPTRTAWRACRSSRSSGSSRPFTFGGGVLSVSAAAVAAAPFLCLVDTLVARGIKTSRKLATRHRSRERRDSAEDGGRRDAGSGGVPRRLFNHYFGSAGRESPPHEPSP